MVRWTKERIVAYTELQILCIFTFSTSEVHFVPSQESVPSDLAPADSRKSVAAKQCLFHNVHLHKYRIIVKKTISRAIRSPEMGTGWRRYTHFLYTLFGRVGTSFFAGLLTRWAPEKGCACGIKSEARTRAGPALHSGTVPQRRNLIL